jgi:hypothetical protein
MLGWKRIKTLENEIEGLERQRRLNLYIMIAIVVATAIATITGVLM